MKRTILSAILLSFLAIIAQAQNITVHGTVLSKSDGEPLIGASIVCEDIKTGVSTDFDGNFKISVPEGATLKFSYVGFNSTEAKAQPEMTIHLEYKGLDDFQGELSRIAIFMAQADFPVHEYSENC